MLHLPWDSRLWSLAQQIPQSRPVAPPGVGKCALLTVSYAFNLACRSSYISLLWSDIINIMFAWTPWKNLFAGPEWCHDIHDLDNCCNPPQPDHCTGLWNRHVPRRCCHTLILSFDYFVAWMVSVLLKKPKKPKREHWESSVPSNSLWRATATLKLRCFMHPYGKLM